MPNGLAGSAQVSYPLWAPDGTAGAPSYSFASDHTTGMYNAAGQVRISSLGNDIVGFDAGSPGMTLISSATLCWGSSALASPDLHLYRDAANVLAQRNSTNGQTLRIYNTYTSGVEFERIALGWAANEFVIGTDSAGTGTARAINMYNGATGTGIALRGYVNLSGTVIPSVSTGAFVLGLTTNRFGALFLGGNTPAASAPMLDCSQTWNDVAQIFIGAKISITNTNSAPGSYSFATYGGAAGVTFAFGIEPSGYGVSAAGFQGPEWRFASNGRFYAPSDGVWVCYNNASSDFTRLCFGGTTVAFPAIARDGANLALVHADGSAGYIDLTVHDVIGSSVYLSNLVGVGANNTNIGLSLTGFAMNIHNSSAALTLAVTGGATLAKFAGTGYLEMYEVTAPSAPAANTGRIYFEDNGAGKTRLMCLFNTGAAQQIAIEP